MLKSMGDNTRKPFSDVKFLRQEIFSDHQIVLLISSIPIFRSLLINRWCLHYLKASW